MDKPSVRKLSAYFSFGVLIALCEPLILLAMGDDIAGALWPMANRSLDWTFFLREWRTEVFALAIISVPFAYIRSSNSSIREQTVSSLILGVTFGLLLIFSLLNIAYLRDAFLLLPTIYGFIILCAVLIIGGTPQNPFSADKNTKNRVTHTLFVLLAIWLISPGLSALAGLSPSPPELDLGDGSYSVSTTIHEYPMPEEVANIQGDYEEDVTFSVYLTLPDDNLDEMPLAIILHGFANPFFKSYVDWVETISSRGVAVAFVQYPSDVMPPGYDTYDLHEEDGMSNHPFHIPRAVAIDAALDFTKTIIPSNVNPSHLMVGGHSLGAGYALLTLDWALEQGWGNESLFVDLETPYARPVQDHLQINLTGIPDEFMAHVAISEDDMSVNDCFGVHHQSLLGDKALFIEVPSDRYGFPRLVASHYLQATETHDTLADWGFYRRVVHQSDWLVARTDGNENLAQYAAGMLLDSPEFRNMGEWSDGTDVKNLGVWNDALNSSKFEHCKSWKGP